MSNDVKRAYFYAPTTRPIFIEIPAEDREPGDEGFVGQLNLSLYGTRDAAKNWSKKFTEVMTGCGFVYGKTSPCNFYNADRQISVTVHGDDFTSTGRARDLEWLKTSLENAFEIKTELLGPDLNKHSQEIRILNRVLTWSQAEITYEADQRHAEILISELEMCGAKPVTTPGAREEVTKASIVEVDKDGKLQNNIDEESSGGKVLDKAEATRYRAMAARSNFLAQDRADVQFAVKEVARRMATPREGDWALLKRLARYLVGAPRAVYGYGWQTDGETNNLDTYVDSDWGGCKGTRRSTSGGVIMNGYHVLKTWSSTQATVSLSSAEAELYALVKGASQTLGMMGILRDLGQETRATINSDASAALGIIQRQGVGKLRHISTQYLWIQEKTRNEEFDISKVPGEDNPADILTKNVNADLIARHLDFMSVRVGTDRAEKAPQLNSIIGDKEGHDDDHWIKTTTGVMRTHQHSSRTELFTPRRIAGAPPAKILTSTRITRGRYEDGNREQFVITDSWRARATAHRTLGRKWKGSTEFIYFQ